MALLDELLVGLGFEYDPKEIQQFKTDIEKTVKVVKNLTRVAVASAAAITSLTIASTSNTDEQGKLAKEIGDTVENIDALQFALKRAGGTSDGMTSSLRQLAIRASEAARGTGSGVEAFGILGVSVTDSNGRLKTTSDLMLEVSNRMQGLNKAQQIELADKLGIRDSVLLLQEGPEAIKALIAEAHALGVTTAEDAAVAEEFQDSLTDLWQIIKSVSRTISKTFAPILKKMVNSFSDWWKLNRQMIEQNFPKWVSKFTSALKLLILAAGAFLAISLVNHLATLITLLRGVSVAAMAANAAALLLPILLGAAVVAFLALVEDAKVFFEGGESFIGDMIEKFPKWADEIKLIASLFKLVLDTTNHIFDGWSRIIDMFSKFSVENLKEILGNIPGFIGDVTGVYGAGGQSGLIPELGQSISNSSKTVVDKVEIIIQGGADTAENIANAVSNVFQQTSQDLNTVVDQ